MAEQATMLLADEVNQGEQGEQGEQGTQENNDQMPPELLEMLSQDNAMKTNLDGLTEESGSMFANPNSLG